MADKRPYTKRDAAYWSRHASPQNQAMAVAGPVVEHVPGKAFPDIVYGSTQVALAGSINGGAPASVGRGASVNSAGSDPGAFANIRAIASPYIGFDGDRDYVGAADAIGLCARAWAGIPVARNAIEVSVEFSSQPLSVKSSNETVETFFNEWFKAIQITRLEEQFFREYYRSGNVFLYRFDGQFGTAHYGHFQSAFGARENRVPIRYELLNPSNVFVPAGISYPYTYVRVLSTWECERLRNPVTPQDKQVFNDLSPEAKQQIKSGGTNPEGVYFPMDPKRLRFAFYKKQDYEPLGVPMIWPVLPSIEWKLTLTKMDKQLARTIDHAILLVTNGEAPSKENGGNGINQNNIARLQALLNNPTSNRVLVADYTTKASWLVPPVQEILGPAKYQVVNEDIREGLQSILAGDDKFANAQIKAKIFVQRLEEGQNRFLNDFLMPEVRAICDIMGFRTVPHIQFHPIDLQDEAVFARIIAQLAQIGVLTAPQAIEAMQTQILPSVSELESGQQAYKKARDKGLYKPLIGGEKEEAGGPGGRPVGSGGGKQAGTRKSSPIGTSKAALDTDAFSIATYAECLKESNMLAAEVEKALRKRFDAKGAFTPAQESVAAALTRTIIATQPRGKWVDSVTATLAKPPVIPADVAAELDEISLAHDVDAFDAGILRHCRCETPKSEIAMATAAVTTAVTEAARAAAKPADRLTIEVKQAEGKPKTVTVTKTAQGFQFTEARGEPAS